MSHPSPPPDDDKQVIVRQDGDKRCPPEPHGNGDMEGNTSGSGSNRPKAY